MTRTSSILQALARSYEASTVGRSGLGQRDVQPKLDDLLFEADAREGDAYELAVRQLEEAARIGIVGLEYDHRRARTRIHKVRLSPSREEQFYQYIGVESPTSRRQRWSAMFLEAAGWQLPEDKRADWGHYCDSYAKLALTWNDMRPFSRDEIKVGQDLLRLAARLLAWNGEHLIRWVSSMLCNDSKQLERQQGPLEKILAKATCGKVTSLADLGILPVDPNVSFHGPLRLCLDGNWHDYGSYQGATTLALADVELATFECHATRCITVENRTPFLELAKCRSGDLIIWTSYPNDATLSLLRKLNHCTKGLEYWHFGDTDPSGFDILNDLRVRSGLPFRSIHMRYRPREGSRKLESLEMARVGRLVALMTDERASLQQMLISGTVGDFEQESLGLPGLRRWPFYQYELPAPRH